MYRTLWSQFLMFFFNFKFEERTARRYITALTNFECELVALRLISASTVLFVLFLTFNFTFDCMWLFLMRSCIQRRHIEYFVCCKSNAKMPAKAERFRVPLKSDSISLFWFWIVVYFLYFLHHIFLWFRNDAHKMPSSTSSLCRCTLHGGLFVLFSIINVIRFHC